MEAVWRGTRAGLHAALRKLPAVLAGVEPDPHGLSRIFLAEVGDAVLEEIRAAFVVKSRGGTGSDGIRWQDLKESTLERRRRKGIDHDRRLEETGALLASLTPGTGDPDAARPANQVFDIEPGGVTVGTQDEKASKHQDGWANVPARPIVPEDGSLPAAWEREVEEAMERGMEKVIEEMCRRGGVG